MNKQHYLCIIYLLLILFLISVKNSGCVQTVPKIPPNPPTIPPIKHNPGL